jgi:hypothetical protein
MKQMLVALSLVMLVAVLLAGCGKSEEMKKIEAALNKEVMDKHDELMKSVSLLDDLTAQIGTATTKHDELIKKYPKLTEGHTASDLVAAQEKISATKAAMDAWMRAFKPYDPEAKHEEVIARLAAQKDELVAIAKQFADAQQVAREALVTHGVAADMVIAKAGGKKH